MKYMTVVFRLADNADGRLVLDAAERISGATVSAIALAHALDERDDLSDEVNLLRRTLEATQERQS